MVWYGVRLEVTLERYVIRAYTTPAVPTHTVLWHTHTLYARVIEALGCL